MSAEQPPPLPQSALPLPPQLPQHAGRPSAIVMMGVSSIVIGGFGLLFNLCGIFVTSLLFASTSVPATPLLPPAPALVQAAAYDGDFIAPEGLKRQQRTLVINQASKR